LRRTTLGTLELPSPSRAKFGSSLFTPASAVFDPFRQIVTLIIRSKTELWIFGEFFIVNRRRLHRASSIITAVC
jgi:hypothetical protein